MGLPSRAAHWSASGSILPRSTAACARPARSCGTSSVRRAGTPLTCRHRCSGNRQEDLVSAWFASLTMKPTQRSGQLVQRAT
jgi:hypothetical protein